MPTIMGRFLSIRIRYGDGYPALLRKPLIGPVIWATWPQLGSLEIWSSAFSMAGGKILRLPGIIVVDRQIASMSEPARYINSPEG
jgi:hypothetical protein